MNRRVNAVTLLELLIAITLLGLVAIGILSFDLFSGFHVTTTDRRAQIQNEVSYLLENMSKEIAKAIGNERVDGANSVIDTSNISNYTAIKVYIDANQNAEREYPPAVGTDYWIAYRFRDNGNDKYQIQYCSRCINLPCTTCDANADILSKKITSFTPLYNFGNNYVEIQLTGRYEPTQPSSLDNPEVTMRTRIKMPFVSTN